MTIGDAAASLKKVDLLTQCLSMKRHTQSLVLGWIIVVAMLQLTANSSVPTSQQYQNALTTGAISGTVLDAARGEPLRSANVRLVSRDGTFERLAVSDSSGHFEFRAVPPGQFDLYAEKVGYLQTGDQGTPASDSEPIRLQSGQSVEGLEIALLPASVIAGVIRDKNGEPLNGVQVRALRVTDEAGQPQLSVAPTPARTDSRGRFRIPNLAAGHYYVEARHAGRLQADVVAGSVLVYAPTYYPGTLTLGEAAQMTLEMATTFEIDMRLAFIPLVQLGGTALDTTGRPLSGVVEVLQLVGTLLVPVTTSFIDPEGSFRIAGVPAGTYVLRTSAAVSSGQPLSASITIAATADRSDIALIARPMARLVGRIEADGLPRGAFLPPLRVIILPAAVGEPPPTTFGGGVVKPDMTFLLAVASGPALIRLANLPPGWVVETITIDGADTTSAPTHLREGEHFVTVTLRRR